MGGWVGRFTSVVLSVPISVATVSPALTHGETAEATPISDSTIAAMETMAPLPTMSAGLLVHDAWTRESPMLELAGAVFMVIENTTTEDDALVGASSPAADVAEIHQTAMAEDITMAMSPVESIPVPAGSRAVLEPGGYHIMLIGLTEPLSVGDSIEISLEFEHAAARTVSALVRPMGPMGALPAPSAFSGED